MLWLVMSHTVSGRVSAGLLRELSVAASVDPRSLRRVLRGERVRGMADVRIRRELARRGIALPELPPEPSPRKGHTT